MSALNAARTPTGMITWRWIALCLASFALPTSSQAKSAAPASIAPASIPFLYEDARIYVPVRIGRGEPHWFILDTGATGTIIDTAVAKSASLPISGGQTVHGAGSGGSVQSQTSAVDLEVGAVLFHVQQPLIMDLAHLLGPTIGRAPAGIIGSQFFREHFVDLDFERHRIKALPPASDRRWAYAAAVPLTFADWTPLTHVRLTLPSGRVVTANALLDLGAKSTFLLPEPFIDREKLRTAFPKTVVSALGSGVGGDTFYAFARARSIGFAAAPAMSLADPVIGLSVKGTLRSTWHEGLLGADFLSRFRLGFDYAHHRLLMTKVGQAAEPFDRSGLFLAAEGSRLDRVMVRQVLEGGPAEAAGLVAGDEIVSVDGKSVKALGLPAVRSRLKQPSDRSVKLEVVHGLARRTVVLKLNALL